jgi:hypothetical protein
MESLLAERARYHSSGKVGAAFSLLATPLTLITALLMGYVMCAVWRAGHYFVVMIPLLASFFVLLPLGLGVHLGKCRNRGTAAVYAVLADVLMYGSYYYFDMVQTHGAGHALRVDALPAISGCGCKPIG